MNSEVVNTGTFTIQLLQNNYQAADTVLLRYRTAADIPTLDGAAWINYTGEFDSLGYVQIRVEATV